MKRPLSFFFTAAAALTALASDETEPRLEKATSAFLSTQIRRR
jgi:hypothetical protein